MTPQAERIFAKFTLTQSHARVGIREIERECEREREIERERGAWVWEGPTCKFHGLSF
jgi:hypothetical protein